MAQRRMFSKEITNSSEFLMMAQSAQNLYFHIGMNSDDDGFCEIFTIMRMTESKPDDLKAVHEKGFIYVVDNKVCIVKDWHENNQIRVDRYKRSKYFDDPNLKSIYLTIMKERIEKIGLYKGLIISDEVCLGKPNDNQMATQVRLGKVRLGKVNNIKSLKELFENEIQPPPEQYIEQRAIFFKRKEEFFEHWTAKNKNDKKERWQLTKGGKFYIKLRWNTWNKNANKWQAEKEDKLKVEFFRKTNQRRSGETGLSKLSDSLDRFKQPS